MRISVDDCRVDGGRGPAAIDTVTRMIDRADTGADRHLSGALLPGLCDAHVHLGLVPREHLERTALARVTDLGWVLDDARTWAADTRSPLHVDVAGSFLAAPGGYPSASAWAAEDSTIAVTTDNAAASVNAMKSAGARVIKVTLNSVAGPVLDDVTLAAVVAAAHAAALPVVVHAEGIGQAARAVAAGADVLAHTPWSERLDDALIDHVARRGMRWISTLDIHGWGDRDADFAAALDNLSRFAAAGGAVVYGTDLGNGPLPVGVNERELAALAEAGLSVDRLLAALDGLLPAPTAAWAYVESTVPDRAVDVSPWVAGARRVSPSDLEHVAS